MKKQPTVETSSNQVRRNTSENSRYTFSGKERDGETGYSYFGARYYNSDISIWLSVDPLSDKYPHQSNYVYCSNNPIRIIDPNGEDEYEFDAYGNFLKRTESDKDHLVIVSENKRTVSGDFDKGTFNQYFQNGSSGKDADGNTIMDGLSRKDAKETFNFMSDNTKVEWGYMESIGKDGNSEFLVGSAHKVEGEPLIYRKAMDASKGSVIKYDHSHQYYINNNIIFGANPSNARTSADSEYSDVSAWRALWQRNPNISMGIRFNSDYQMWIKKGVPIDGFGNEFYFSK